MIGFIEGLVAEKSIDHVIINVGGIGYRLFVSGTSLAEVPSIDESVRLFTHLHIRDDIMHLYGFTTKAEKASFERLLSVGKIGPKIALSILSSFPVATLQQAILTSDVDLLTSVPGIGKKGAQRIILELREKMDLEEFDVEFGRRLESGDDRLLNAGKALKSLGYSGSEISQVFRDMDITPDMTIEACIKTALKKLGQSDA